MKEEGHGGTTDRCEIMIVMERQNIRKGRPRVRKRTCERKREMLILMEKENDD